MSSSGAGAGAVTDAAVAGLVGTPSDTQTALDGRYTPTAGTDAEVAGLVGSASATRTALDGRYGLLATVNGKVDKSTLLFDIRDYAAVADGVTDNAAAINNAIQAAQTAGGGSVLVPAAAQPWATGSTITLRSNVTLLLFGTIKALASHTGRGVTGTNVSNVAITGPGTIDMNKAATADGGSLINQQAIYIVTNIGTASLLNVRIAHITVANCWYRGIHVAASIAGSTFDTVRVTSVTTSATGDLGIYVAAIGSADSTTPSLSHNIWLARNVVVNPGGGGIQAVGVSDLHIIDNHVIAAAASGHGICVGGGSAGVLDQCTDFVVARNDVRGFTAVGKWGLVVSARCTRFVVAHNISNGNAGGLSVDVTDPNNSATIITADGTVIGNTCKGGLSSHGININHATALQLIGNVCRANAGSGLAVATSTGVVIAANTCTNNAVHGIALFGTSAGVGGHVVSGNQSLNNNTGGTGHNYWTDATPVGSTIGSTTAYATTTP